MGLSAFIIYRLMLLITASNLISIIISIAVAVVVYFVLIFISKSLSKDEIEMLPMGTKIYKAASKLHLV